MCLCRLGFCSVLATWSLQVLSPVFGWRTGQGQPSLLSSLPCLWFCRLESCSGWVAPCLPPSGLAHPAVVPSWKVFFVAGPPGSSGCRAPMGAELLSLPLCAMPATLLLLLACKSGAFFGGSLFSLLNIVLNQAELAVCSSPGVISSHQSIPQRALRVPANRTQRLFVAKSLSSVPSQAFCLVPWPGTASLSGAVGRGAPLPLPGAYSSCCMA